ncbi:MAG: PQQ-dependent sugar dehydrogenase [Microbacteriaceae bacterium]
MRAIMTTITAGAAVALVAGCTASPTTRPAPEQPPTSAAPTSGVEPSGEVTEVATGLAAPWSVVALDDGTALVSERDSAAIQHVGADGALAEVGVIDGVVPGGEGGLLGLATHADASGDTWLYAYFTAADDNRIVRMPLDTSSGASPSLGSPEVVLEGLDKARTHNGGRIAFGPDDLLYVTTGDAGEPSRSQDPESLSGKILRLTPEGEAADGNPTDGSPVYSMGHRNPQGIAWDDDGQLWAAEFGQNTWDEFNRIEPGANYGWPEVEGIVEDERFVDPVAQWTTDESSPSGLGYVDGTFFLAALRGERLWAISPDGDAAAASTDFLTGDYGRLRDAVAAPDGGLWVLTNNTDGRGSPTEGDDRLLHVELTPVPED